MIEPTRNDAYISYERLLDDWWDTHKGDVYLREDPVAVEEEEEVEIQTLVPREPDSEELQFDDEESSAIFVPDEEEEEEAKPTPTFKGDGTVESANLIVFGDESPSGPRFVEGPGTDPEILARDEELQAALKWAGGLKREGERPYYVSEESWARTEYAIPLPDEANRVLEAYRKNDQEFRDNYRKKHSSSPASVTYGQGVTTLEQLSADIQSAEVKRRSDNAYTGALIALTDYAEEFNKYGDLYDVDPLLIASIAGYESGGNPDAVGPTNDVGLMQFTPRTWQEIMPGRSLDERIDPVLSIEAAAKLLDRERKALESIDLAVLAYNVGVPRVGQIIRGESEFPGISNFYYPVVNLTYERLRDSLSSAGSQQ